MDNKIPHAVNAVSYQSVLEGWTKPTYKPIRVNRQSDESVVL